MFVVARRHGVVSKQSPTARFICPGIPRNVARASGPPWLCPHRFRFCYLPHFSRCRSAFLVSVEASVIAEILNIDLVISVGVEPTKTVSADPVPNRKVVFDTNGVFVEPDVTVRAQTKQVRLDIGAVVWRPQRLDMGRLGVPARNGLNPDITDLAREVIEVLYPAALRAVANDPLRGHLSALCRASFGVGRRASAAARLLGVFQA